MMAIVVVKPKFSAERSIRTRRLNFQVELPGVCLPAGVGEAGKACSRPLGATPLRPHVRCDSRLRGWWKAVSGAGIQTRGDA